MTKPYIKVDVGALTESLFESELFGHKKGAFTDAREDREGRFEAPMAAHFFWMRSEIFHLHQQAKLLSVLQNRQVTRLGSTMQHLLISGLYVLPMCRCQNWQMKPGFEKT